ncbi:MAG: acyltransferase [Mesorhizobium sp.]|jgi:peptidoglycan/LPS O-acetylase OafA/YrhL|uniref:acyltransferase family protein n=1 Tax=Mesorhizobium sp. TaxID=1871066 RepID=UPI000FE9D48E|nr:acyltransferase [Mesorhizobium sp.]RWM14312.1 MAG: acyltransferase [Mesorhizobium sp.]
MQPIRLEFGYSRIGCSAVLSERIKRRAAGKVSDMGDIAISRREFVPGLEASRGVAALMVALFHCGQATYFDATRQTPPLVPGSYRSQSYLDAAFRIAGNGHGAVVFFFVLSGFVLMMMLSRQNDDLKGSAGPFLIGRVLRIYPAVFSTIAIFVGLFLLTGMSLGTPAAYSTSNVIANSLLLRTDINGVMWSLQTEMIAAPLIFSLYWSWRQWGSPSLLLPAFVLIGLSFSKEWSGTPGNGVSLGNLYSFVVGMIACACGKTMVARLPHSASLLVLAIAGFALSRPLLGWWSNWSVILETVFAGLITTFIAYGDPLREGRLMAAARYFGRISYSFYLLHALTLIALWNMPALFGKAVSAGIPPIVLALVAFVSSVLVITPLAHLQHAIVERAGARLGRALTWRLRPKLQADALQRG